MKKVWSFLEVIGLACLLIGAYTLPVWAVIEFILYLVKDRAFNWWSFWLTLVDWLLLILVTLYGFLKEEITKPEPTKSAFQRRLELMSERRKKEKS